MTFEEIPAGTNRADHQPERVDPAPESQDVDVEGVSPRGPLRPAGVRQVVAADHRSVTLEEGDRQPALDRRQRHPTRSVAQDAVFVEEGDPRPVSVGPLFQPRQAGLDIGVTSRHPDPVLEAVLDIRRTVVTFNQEQTGSPLPGQIGPARRFSGPTQENDVHVFEAKDTRLPTCFVQMNRPARRLRLPRFSHSPRSRAALSAPG